MPALQSDGERVHARGGDIREVSFASIVAKLILQLQGCQLHAVLLLAWVLAADDVKDGLDVGLLDVCGCAVGAVQVHVHLCVVGDRMGPVGYHACV